MKKIIDLADEICSLTYPDALLFETNDVYKVIGRF